MTNFSNYRSTQKFLELNFSLRTLLQEIISALGTNFLSSGNCIVWHVPKLDPYSRKLISADPDPQNFSLPRYQHWLPKNQRRKPHHSFIKIFTAGCWQISTILKMCSTRVNLMVIFISHVFSRELAEFLRLKLSLWSVSEYGMQVGTLQCSKTDETLCKIQVLYFIQTFFSNQSGFSLKTLFLISVKRLMNLSKILNFHLFEVCGRHGGIRAVKMSVAGKHFVSKFSS